MISTNLDSKFDLSNQKITKILQKYSSKLHPDLACKINFYQEQIIFAQDGREFGFKVDERSRRKLEKLFSMMDGTNSIEKLQQIFFTHQPEVINSIVQTLDEQGFLDGITEIKLNSGLDTLRELQDFSKDLLDKNFKSNQLWQSINLKIDNLPLNILYGFAIEHYYLFSHKCSCETSLLNWQNSAKVRKLMNKVYFQEYGQEELLIQALKTININHEKLINTMPLPETMGLVNALSYWANFEPLFYFVTLEILSSQTWQNFELYLKTCEEIKLDSSFIAPIRELVNTKLPSKLEKTAYQIFQEICHIDRETRKRFRSQTHLFIEMYNNFYEAIWNHYSSSEILLRQVSAI